MRTVSPRIAPVEPPYEPRVAEILAKWMPPGAAVPPLALFRTIARHPMLIDRMRPLASGLLGRGTLSPRVRELLVLRTSARCNATYEWSVHATAFARAVGLDEATVNRTATAPPEAITSSDDDALVLRVADELHDRGNLSDDLFEAAQARLGDQALLEMAATVGFYHLIAFIIGTARVEPEPWAAEYPIPAS